MMKRVILGFIVLVLLVAGTALIPAEHPQGDEEVHLGFEATGLYPVQSVSEIALGTALPKYPGQVTVYKTVDTTVSKDDALKMAEKFGMSEPVEEYETSYVIKGSPYTFEIEKETGYMTYTWYGRWMGSNERDRPEYLPTDEEARKIAETFLTSNDLMPDGAAYSSISHDRGAMLSAEGNETVVADQDTTVLFTGRLSNLSVVGNGIYVTLGGDGDVLRVAKRWRDVEPYKEFAILSPEEAIEELKQTGVVTTVSSPKKAVVDEIKLCYYATPPGTEQPYLKPTYYFHGTMEGENETGTFYQYIPAVPELGKGLY
ncbi:hypothetical protein [Methanoculleus sp.]|uniref:hypothetical protein n=1 Tax=Methanoculleus sp. TaxID=90427 RepID=UPI002600D512|nr:hypothetical protein [Methanoculleus sp.]MCK9318020.1 hypothetical protein [Methanoculleus sp.]MDD2255429.1 hypothetical protein [Methanoculleus sp.]